MSDTKPSRRRFLWSSLAALALASCRKAPAPSQAATIQPPPPTGTGARTGAPRPPQPSHPRGWNQDVSFKGDPSRLGKITWNSGSSAQPYVAITFDDGPHVTNTPRLLDILKSRNVKATFYVLGPRVNAHPQIVRRMVAEGHEIGNHSWTHRVMSKLPDSAVYKEFKDTEQAVVAACGVKPKTQRPPYGAMTATQRAMLKERLGYPCIMWNVDPEDWKRPGASVVSSRILSNTRNGSIILLHDIHAASVDAVPAVLDGLIAKGFTFTTVSSLLSLSATPA